MKGRQRLPAIVKKAQGNTSHRRPRPPAVEPPLGLLEPTFKLDAVAQREFNRIAEAAEWLRPLDASALSDRCQCWSRLIAAERDISKRGSVIRTRNGMTMNASIRISRTYRVALQKWDEQLGISLVARSRITDTEPKAAPMDPIAEALYGGRLQRV